MEKSYVHIFLTAGVVTLFLLSSCASGFTKNMQSIVGDSTQKNDVSVTTDALVTCYAGGKPYAQTISYESGAYLQELFSQLATANAHDPWSVETQQLQHQILVYAEQQKLLPPGLTAEMIQAQLGEQNTILEQQHLGEKHPLSYEGTGREMFCNFVSAGQGSAVPIIILPRLIPIIMTPIPRLFVGWKTSSGVTSCGGLVSRTGFLAYGEQQGFALGFWGIGFSIFLPPVMAYGMFGYALYSKVSAEYMEYYPPNHPPKVTAVYPLDGATNIPLSTNELQFHISDSDTDLMSYSVTTSPDVGGGNGNMKTDGTYTVSVNGLEPSTEYTWTVQVTDSLDTVVKEYTFTTVMVAPVVSNPLPKDSARFIPLWASNVSFDLLDYQGDLMDWTVETQPDIGAGGGNGVGNGRYTVAISGLDYFTNYTWFVNVTDGQYWMKKRYSFTTTAEGVLGFEPTDDVTIHQNNPDANQGDSKKMTVRNEDGGSGTGWNRDVLIKFDVSSIPSDADIQYAYLQLYYIDWHDNNPSGRILNLFRATSVWDENTVTWNTQPTYAPQLSAYAVVPSAVGTWMEWDVTLDVQQFHAGSEQNFGWKLTDDQAWGGPNIPISYFCSKEYGEYSPLLIIGYEL